MLTREELIEATIQEVRRLPGNVVRDNRRSGRITQVPNSRLSPKATAGMQAKKHTKKWHALGDKEYNASQDITRAVNKFTRGVKTKGAASIEGGAISLRRTTKRADRQITKLVREKQSHRDKLGRAISRR